MLDYSERLLDRMPVVRGLYKGVKQIFETVFSQSGTSFKKVGLVQYPAKGMWSLVFISAEPKGDLATALPGGADHVGVFLPCAPNPTTGFFFYLPRADVIEITMTPDEAAKLVMSAGLIQPRCRSGWPRSRPRAGARAGTGASRPAIASPPRHVRTGRAAS